MKICLLFILIIFNFICLTLSIDVSIFKLNSKTDLWAFVISTSDRFENFRHSINPLIMYNFLKKNGIPDERIILGLSEFHACSPHSFFPGELYLTEGSDILQSCNTDINIDYKDSDFHNFQILDLLKGRSNQLINNFRKINSNKNSRIIMIITSHGGENFIKVRGKSVILSDELNRTLNEMYIKERFKEILFILDTCGGGTLFDFVDVPNVYFVASSSKDQKSNSYSYDTRYMTPTSDKFHFKLHQIIQRIHEEKSFKMAIHSLFMEIKAQRNFLDTDVAILNKIDREILFEEFFGNYLKKHHSNEKYNFNLNIKEDSETKANSFPLQNFHIEINSLRNKMDEEVLEIKKYNEDNFTNLIKESRHINKNKILSELIIFKNVGSGAFIFFSIIYMMINLIKK